MSEGAEPKPKSAEERAFLDYRVGVEELLKTRPSPEELIACAVDLERHKAAFLEHPLQETPEYKELFAKIVSEFDSHGYGEKVFPEILAMAIHENEKNGPEAMHTYIKDELEFQQPKSDETLNISSGPDAFERAIEIVNAAEDGTTLTRAGRQVMSVIPPEKLGEFDQILRAKRRELDAKGIVELEDLPPVNSLNIDRALEGDTVPETYGLQELENARKLLGAEDETRPVVNGKEIDEIDFKDIARGRAQIELEGRIAATQAEERKQSLESSPAQVEAAIGEIRLAKSEEDIIKTVTRNARIIPENRMGEYQKAVRERRAVIEKELEIRKQEEDRARLAEIDKMTLGSLSDLDLGSYEEEREQENLPPLEPDQELVATFAYGSLLEDQKTSETPGVAGTEKGGGKIAGTIREAVYAEGVHARRGKEGKIDIQYAEELRIFLEKNDHKLVEDVNEAALILIATDAQEAQEDFKMAVSALREKLVIKYPKIDRLINGIVSNVFAARDLEHHGAIIDEIVKKEKKITKEVEKRGLSVALGSISRSFKARVLEEYKRSRIKKLISAGVAASVATVALIGGADWYYSRGQVKVGPKPIYKVKKVTKAEEKQGMEVLPESHSPEKVRPIAIETIKKGDSASRAAYRIAKAQRMSGMEFRLTWFNPESQIEFADGTCFQISYGNLTLKDDKVLFFEGKDGKPGYFKVETVVKNLKKAN